MVRVWSNALSADSILMFEVQLKDASLFIEKGHIGGEWLASSSSKTFSVDSTYCYHDFPLSETYRLIWSTQDPANCEIIGHCPEFTKQDTQQAIRAAASAFQDFRATRPRQRSRLLRKWYDLIMSNQDDLSVLITLENGKALADARAEVAYAASFLEWFSEEAPRTYGDAIPATNAGNQILTAL